MEAKTTKKAWSKEDLEYFKNLILKKREETLKAIERLEATTVSDSSRNDNTAMDSADTYHMADVVTD